MKYWKLMAGRGSQYVGDFLEENYIAVGFAKSPEAMKADSVEDFREVIRKAEPEATKGQLFSWGPSLRKFYKELNAGDRVLVYEPGTRLYHIAEVLSEARFDEDKPLWHVRDVKWVGTVARDDLSVPARNALGSILSLFAVNEDVRKEIESALSGSKSTYEDEVFAEEEIQNEGEEVANRAKEFTKDRILQLDWDEMQELVAGLLRAMGYKTKVSAAGPDRGKDIVASRDGLGLEDPRIHVEVKHRKGQMGAPEIRAFAGGLRQAKGLYVSTGGFSREAFYEAERSEAPITLMDIDELARMIVRNYDNFDTEARDILPLKKIYWPL